MTELTENDFTRTRRESAMIDSAIFLIKTALRSDGQVSIFACGVDEPLRCDLAKLADTLAQLRLEHPSATLTLDIGAGKFDVESDGKWIGGVWLFGEKAGDFYPASSVRMPTANVYKGGAYDRVLG